jgi:hypothetical protein
MTVISGAPVGNAGFDPEQAEQTSAREPRSVRPGLLELPPPNGRLALSELG